MSARISEPVQMNSAFWLIFFVYQIDATQGAVVLASGTSSPNTTAFACVVAKGAIKRPTMSEVARETARPRRRIDIVTPLRKLSCYIQVIRGLLRAQRFLLQSSRQ